MAAWESLLQSVLPARCAGCGTPAPALCSLCRAGLTPAPRAGPPAGIDWWLSPFAYEGALRRLVAGAKYRGAHVAFRWLAGELAAVVSASEAAGGLEVVTWPPTSPARRRQRGFDPGEWLARRVAAELGLPARSLLRRHPGPAQTGRDRKARALAGPTFTARTPAGGRLLVVDDVATTGATLVAAARALRGAGAVVVGAATAARTPRSGALSKNCQEPLKPPLRHTDS